MTTTARQTAIALVTGYGGGDDVARVLGEMVADHVRTDDVVVGITSVLGELVSIARGTVEAYADAIGEPVETVLAQIAATP